MHEHFVRAPGWGWYVVWYFFLGGVAGGAYVLGAMLRLRRDARDEPVARTSFVLAFVTMAICPLLLTLDLGRPARFWHMLVDPTGPALNLRPISPMSVGAWILLGFGLFSTVSFADALARRRLLGEGTLSLAFHAIGALFGLGLAGYTGVLLSVSNQPLWSDTWALGGLFLASALGVAAAALGLLAGHRADAVTVDKLRRAADWFLVLEIAWLVVFFVTLGPVGIRYVTGGWLVAWLLVLLGIVVPIVTRARAASVRHGVAAAVCVLISGLALRIAVVFGAQT